jgi:hypothetical protein
MRSIFIQAGLHEWPIPIPRPQRFHEDLGTVLGLREEEPAAQDPIFDYENYDFEEEEPGGTTA